MWSQEQQGWCCAHRGAGCTKEVESSVPAAPVEESIPTDAPADNQTQTAAESSDVKSKVERRTEPPVALSMFTPSDGSRFVNGKQWSQRPAQRDRPLSKHGRTSLQKEAGDSRKGVNYDCVATHVKWQEWWDDAKRSWCCANKQIACTTTSATTGSQAFESPRELMPQIQPVLNELQRMKQEVLQAGEPHDCADGLLHWRVTWSREKKEWCCEHERLGCPWTTTTGSPQDFDCQNFEVPWTETKQHWCCLHKSIRCPAKRQQQQHQHFMEQRMLERYEDQDASQSSFLQLRTASTSAMVALCACLAALLLLLTAVVTATRVKILCRRRRECAHGGRRLLYLAVGDAPPPSLSLAFSP